MSDKAGPPPAEGSVRVVGTAHVSADSVREVEEAIEAERPDVVAVELDEGRYRQMQGETPDDLDAGDLLRGNTVFQFIAYWMLSYVQAQLGEKFDVRPGADMLAAIETAERHGLDVALVDRDIQVTIQRFWARMGIVEKLRMIGGLAFGVTDSRVVGLVAGLFVGVFLGPLIGLFGGSFGVTDALLTRVTGGLLLAVVVGFALDYVGDAFLDGKGRLLVAVGGGVAVGLIAGVGLGLADGVVSAFGSFAVHAIGSMGLGLVAGLGVGLVAAAVFPFVAPEPEDVEEFDMSELTDTDVVSVMMEEFREFSPGGAEALIDERDAYIAHRLVALRRRGADVVAVVGAGHREGIERYLANPETLPPMESLVGTAKKRGVPWFEIVGVLMSVGFLAFFLLLAMAGVRNAFLLQLFGAWFLVNGLFAAGLAKLAGARWTSAAVGGGVAWMTSVNPLLAPGWFTGYVELRHTRVNVSDIATLNELLGDEEKPLKRLVSEMFDVPLFRLIMIVAMTNVGSIIASVLFTAYILPLFGAELGGVDGVTRLMLEGAGRSADAIWRAVT
ncbi:TraB/GumN family protein [Halegenticoccus tardaugens]|uniref:TraB/GumN family protein n=1 Tax=Halegenticoccus tardaugens TaxID=2071624 RepID=UPI00100A4605|nr:TraB/GumN family protein [Halegenticoccus tardaugens]